MEPAVDEQLNLESSSVSVVLEGELDCSSSSTQGLHNFLTNLVLHSGVQLCGFLGTFSVSDMM